jgi:predicted transcriptional regulator
MAMNALTKRLLEEVETWPPEDQEELAEYAREIRGRRTGVYRLSEEERAGIERGLEDMRAGRFATDEEIAAIFRRARSFHA